MPRRRVDPSEGVSLFPFMSILACLIGILTLMISVNMQLQQLDRQGRTEEEMARAIENRDLKKTAEQRRKKIEELKKRIEKEASTVSQMAKLEEARIKLTEEQEDLKKATDPELTDAALQKLVENLKTQIAILIRERPPLDARLAELQAQLTERQAQPAPEQSVVVQPGGIGVKTAENLFFVECNSTGIVLRREDQPPLAISTAAITTDPDFHAFLDSVKGTHDSMILFLVRKAGNTSYLWAAGFAESKYGVTTGKLPIPNDGKIDLSLFN